MINWMLKLVIPEKIAAVFSGAKNFLSGKKTYLAGAILVLQALSAIIEQFTALNGLADLVGWIKSVAGNSAIQQFGLALGMMGLRAGISKSAEKVAVLKPE
ncbi:MAG: hypothetical protein NTW04_02925 [Elusimicrobia bacterium]|nr:hypothetical protein [Elusimicrobiota bacterium]